MTGSEVRDFYVTLLNNNYGNISQNNLILPIYKMEMLITTALGLLHFIVTEIFRQNYN